ncbi:MAG: PorV/PorQ family protein, partial [Elusimicrobiota bacterium]
MCKYFDNLLIPGERFKEQSFIALFNIILILIVCIVNINAGVGKSGAVFLQEGLGPRPLSMGSAFCAISDDANAVFSNPAGFNYLTFPEFFTMYRQGFIDSFYGSFGYFRPLTGTKGAIEFSGLLFDGGEVELNYLDGTAQTVKTQQDSAFTVGYGNNFNQSFFWGLNAKYIRSVLAGGKYSASTFAADFGMLYRTINNKLSLGVALTNVGTGLKYINVTDPLPQETTFGAAFKPVETSVRSFILSAEIAKSNTGTSVVRFGTELQVFKLFFLRAGYSGDSKDSALTAGFGIRVPGPAPLHLDYGYSPSTKLDPSNRISITMRFGSHSFYNVAEKYYSKKMLNRAQYYLAKVQKDDPQYAAAQNKLSEIDSELARQKAIEIARARERETLRQGLQVQSASKPPSIKVDNNIIRFIDDTGDRVLSALESGTINFYIENQKGAGVAFDVKAQVSCLQPQRDIDFTGNIFIGDLQPGAGRKATIYLKSGAKLKDGKLNFNITFTEKFGFTTDPLVVEIPTQELKEPDIQIARLEIDDGRYENDESRMCMGNGDGIIQRGESAEVTLTILNKGRGPARNLRIKPVSSSPDAPLIAGQDELSVRELKPGEWKTLFFAFSVSRLYSGNSKLPLTLTVNEEREIFNKFLP